jgi:hypothetical protein
VTLLKNDETIPKRNYEISVNTWPSRRKAEGIGLSINDGWYFGIGFGLAMAIAVPIILLTIGFIIGIVLSVLGAL